MKLQEPNSIGGKQVGLWIRVSTEDQVKGESPETHEARARMYAEMKGWTVAKVYRLDAISGKSVMGRPEAIEMLADVREGTITGLIFSKLARLARNTKELLEFADIFRREGADLISLAESIDTSSPAGRFFYTLIAALAEWEREEISARIAASVPIRAKLGKPVAGKAPYGYRWENKARLMPDPSEAPILKLVFELFREHRLIGRVARLLNEAGYRTRKGQLFADMTIRELLTNPVAKGLHRANYSRSDGVKRLIKPEHEWVWTNVEPVVSEEIWEECNAYLKDRLAKVKRTGRPAVHLFTGVTFCSCGRKMRVPSNSPKYICNSRLGGCHNKIPTADLEQVFHEKLRDFFLDPQEVAAYLSEGDEALCQKEDLLVALLRERTRVSSEMDKLYRLYQDEGLSTKSFGERHRPLEERASQLDTEIPRLQGEVDFLKIQQVSAAGFVVEAGSLYARWPQLPFEDRRQIVEQVVERIVVGKGEIEINLAYTPPPTIPPFGTSPSSTPPSSPPSPKGLAKRHGNQITAKAWSIFRPIWTLGRSGPRRAGRRKAARASCFRSPARGSARSSRGLVAASGAGG
ncbi:MAG: recombinase family protein [Acidobacteriota bacterium]